MDQKEVKKYLLIVLILILIAISFLIIKPFINVILAGIVLAYIFYPIHKKINHKLKNDYISSTITLILIIAIIIIPLVLITNSLIKESITIYKANSLEGLSDLSLKIFGPGIAVNQYLEKPVDESVKYINQIAKNFIISIPSKILAFFIMLFIIFYSLIHGEGFLKKIKTLIPLKDKEELLKYIGETTNNLIYGLFIIAILEFLITALGFKIIGVSTPILWGVVIGILAFVPIIGPAIIWIPFTIIELMNDHISKAIGILIVGIILSIVDNIFRPQIIGSKAKIHPVIALLGILGGIKLLGIPGIIIGPLFLSISITIIDLYTKKWN